MNASKKNILVGLGFLIGMFLGALGTKFLAIDMTHAVHGGAYLFILTNQWLNLADVS